MSDPNHTHYYLKVEKTHITREINNFAASQGPAGAKGPRGIVGDSGIQGPQGNPGPAGNNGLLGARGPTGIQGQTGIQGLSGTIGNIGDTGVSIKGDTGVNGIKGDTGVKGPTGLIGDTGISQQGDTGIINKGPTGIQGDTGPSGFKGPTGPIGNTGITAYNGSNGFVYNILILGETGVRGLKGIEGVGLIGPTGVMGPTGPSGGPTGATGPAGSFNGPTGATGPNAQISYSESFVIAVGNNNGGNKMAYSYDGLSWLTLSSGNSVFVNDVYCVSWNGKLWVAGGSSTNGSTNTVAYSFDGIFWFASSSGTTVFGTSLISILWNGSLWLGCGVKNNGGMLGCSYDGINWLTILQLPGTTTCFSIGWNNNIYIVGCNGSNTVLFSYDTYDWFISSLSSFFTTSCNTIFWNGILWVAGGNGTNQLVYSYDGLSWTASPTSTTSSPFSTSCNIVSWNGSLWVAGGDSDGTTSSIVWSNDGINWTSTSYKFFNVKTLTWNGTLWIAGGATINNINSMAYSYDGKTWSNLSSTYTLTNGTYNGSSSQYIVNLIPKLCLMVAVGNSYNNNKIAYSYDGLNWLVSTSGNSLFPSHVYCVAYNGKLWVAGSANPVSLAYSTDGIIWSPSPSNSQFGIIVNTIAFNSMMWVCGGTYPNGTTIALLYSFNGINWLAATCNLTYQVFAVKWNNICWIAVGAGSNGANGANPIQMSYDGIYWRGVIFKSSLTNVSLTTLDFNSDHWVAGGYKLNFVVDHWVLENYNITFYSTDSTGTVWYSGDYLTSPSNPLVFPRCNSIVYNGKLWVAGGENNGSPSPIMTSTDGYTWVETSYNSLAVKTITWNGSFWLAGGIGSGNQSSSISMAYSYDGQNWSNVSFNNQITYQFNGIGSINTTNHTINTPTNISASISTFTVAVANNDNYRMAYSYDGLNWSVSTSGHSVFTSTVYCIAYNGILWVAGSGNPAGLAYSSDGINWTSSLINIIDIDNRIIYYIGWNDTMWIALQTQLYNNAPYSSYWWSNDGMSWTFNSDFNINNILYTVKWNGSYWLIGGVNTLLVSTDGTDWSSSSTFFSNNSCLALEWNGQIWVAGGTTPKQLSYSFDGITWIVSPSSQLIGTTCKCLGWNGSLWVAGGVNKIVISSDGIIWTSTTYNLLIDIRTISWNGVLWIAAGLLNNYTGIIDENNELQIIPVGNVVMSYSYDGNLWFNVNFPELITNQFNGLASINYVRSYSNNISRSLNNISSIQYIKYNISGIPPTYSVSNTMTKITNIPTIPSNIPGISSFTSTIVMPVLNTIMIAVGNNNTSGNNMGYSYDGFVLVPLISGNPLANIKLNFINYYNGIWIAGGDSIGNSTALIYSYNGINWGRVSTSINYDNPLLKSITWINNLGLIVVSKLSNIGIFSWVIYINLTNNTLNINNNITYQAVTFDGPNTTSSRLSLVGTLNVIKYNGTITLIGGVNTLFLSTNGINWTQPAVSFFANFNCLALEWTGTMWIAGGSSTTSTLQFAYSTNGTTWTASPSGNLNGGSGSKCNCIAWNGTLLVAGCENNGTPLPMATSTDGINWTASSYISFVVKTIAWNGTLWYVGGKNGSISYSSNPRTWDSWSGLYFPIQFALEINSIAFNNTVYPSTILNINNTIPINNIYTSSITTTIINTIGTTSTINIITKIGPNTYTANSIPNTKNIINIIDQIAPTTYTTYRISNTNNISKNLLLSVKTFMVAVGNTYNNNTIAYSYDGINWSPSISGNSLFNSNVYCVAYNGTLWVAGSEGSVKLAYSTDGINWTTCSLIAYTVDNGKITSISYNDRMWIAIQTKIVNNNTYSSYWWSNDGINWIINSNFNINYKISTIKWNGSYWLIAGDNILLLSDDGYRWSILVSFFNTSCLEWNSKIWVAGGMGSKQLAYSSNGINWVFSPSGSIFGNRCNCIAWNGSLWVAGCENDGLPSPIVTSIDGINWIATSYNSMAVKSISWNGVLWIAGGNGVGNQSSSISMAYSYNGSNWSNVSFNNQITYQFNASATKYSSKAKDINNIKYKTKLLTMNQNLFSTLTGWS